MAMIEVEGLAELRRDLRRMDETLHARLPGAIADGGRMVAGRVEQNAPRRSGQMAGSVRSFLRGDVAEVRVMARRVSPAYPGGYPYPLRVERLEPFASPALESATPQVVARTAEVLDDLADIWSRG